MVTCIMAPKKRPGKYTGMPKGLIGYVDLSEKKVVDKRKKGDPRWATKPQRLKGPLMAARATLQAEYKKFLTEALKEPEPELVVTPPKKDVPFFGGGGLHFKDKK